MHFLAFSKNEFFHEEARRGRALYKVVLSFTMINHGKQKLVTGVIPNKSKLTWNQTLQPVFAKLLLPLNSILAKGSYPLVPTVFRHTLFPHFDMYERINPKVPSLQKLLINWLLHNTMEIYGSMHEDP